MGLNSIRGPVATLDSALLGEHYLNWFSEAERAEIVGTRNAQRRQERMAGRLAAKFLFLNRDSGLPSLIHLNSSDLERHSAEAYRAAVVSRSEKVRAGLPQISGHNVAIAHTGGLACAFLGKEAPISLDIERAEQRTGVFYAGNFTPLERAWAASVSQRLRLEIAWTYTFLWTAKECLLKSPWFRDLSIADLPSMNVTITSGEEQLIHPHAAREFLAGFVFLQADVADRSRTVQVDLAVSGRYDLVLTAVERRIVI